MSAIIKWVFYDRGTLRPRFSRKRGFLAAVREGWPFIGVTTRLDNDASAGADRQVLITAPKEPIVASTPVARFRGAGQKRESSAPCLTARLDAGAPAYRASGEKDWVPLHMQGAGHWECQKTPAWHCSSPGLKCGRRPTAVIPQSMEVGTDIPVKVHKTETIGQVWGRTAHQQGKDEE